MQTDSRSYWQSTVPAIPLSTELPRMVDAAVIGGGLVGTATRYWLSRQGVPVALLERSALAAGATGRNGGFVVAGPAESYPKAIAHLGYEAARAIMEVTYESQTLLRQVLQEEAIACDYPEPGTIRLALTQEQVQQLTQEVETRQADGFPAHFLERDHIETFIKTPMTEGSLVAHCC